MTELVGFLEHVFTLFYKKLAWLLYECWMYPTAILRLTAVTAYFLQLQSIAITMERPIFRYLNGFTHHLLIIF